MQILRLLRRLGKQSNRRTRWGILVLALSAALLLASCGGSGSPSPTPPNTTPDGVIRLEVDLDNYAFFPREFRFNAGDTVDFVLFSSDDVHTFTVADLGINWVVPGGETQTHRATFDQPGLFRVLCTIPTHETLGMVGTITVN